MNSLETTCANQVGNRFGHLFKDKIPDGREPDCKSVVTERGAVGSIPALSKFYGNRGGE